VPDAAEWAELPLEGIQTGYRFGCAPFLDTVSAVTLFLIRHAVAGVRNNQDPEDDRRPLDSIGIDQAQVIAAGWSDPDIEAIYSSRGGLDLAFDRVHSIIHRPQRRDVQPRRCHPGRAPEPRSWRQSTRRPRMRQRVDLAAGQLNRTYRVGQLPRRPWSQRLSAQIGLSSNPTAIAVQLRWPSSSDTGALGSAKRPRSRQLALALTYLARLAVAIVIVWI